MNLTDYWSFGEKLRGHETHPCRCGQLWAERTRTANDKMGRRKKNMAASGTRFRLRPVVALHTKKERGSGKFDSNGNASVVFL